MPGSSDAHSKLRAWCREASMSKSLSYSSNFRVTCTGWPSSCSARAPTGVPVASRLGKRLLASGRDRRGS